MFKLKLKLLYFKTYLYQIFNKMGVFPFEHYMYMANLAHEKKCKNILEIGTGLGLSTSSLLMVNKHANVTTIEKHPEILKKAKKNIFNICGDVSERLTMINERYFDWVDRYIAEPDFKKFDFIFLDAYVSRYNEVERLGKLLAGGGVFVVSNIRTDMPKSIMAKEELLYSGKYDFIKMLGDTVFVIKK